MWSKIQFLNSKKEIERLKLELDTTMSSPTGTLDTITTLQSLLLQAHKAAMDFWRHRSTLLWLILGEKKSSYFQTVAKGRNARKEKCS